MSLFNCSDHPIKFFLLPTLILGNDTLKKLDSVIDVKNDILVIKAPLLQNRKPHCKAINNQHIPSHQEIVTGTILLNSFNGNTKIDKEEMELEGTYLIQFQNSTVYINEDKYESIEAKYAEATPPLLQLMAEKMLTEEVLSLQMLKKSTSITLGNWIR
ncbi:uncharacterized protein LOC127565066 [Drosophila albomicans]|uniref:Uncharacterized protein LOC127565066 n=1 Tax=Drosophila albomicans TaxID=7291 RepID=A0A9C6WCE2_DROAB|nr:uncharacterized protein LOC127565066 [Drosophila albomicans]